MKVQKRESRYNKDRFTSSLQPLPPLSIEIRKDKVKNDGTEIERNAYLGSAGFACTFVSLVGAGNAESPESLEIFFGGGDFSWGFGRLSHRKGNRRTGSGRFEVLSL